VIRYDLDGETAWITLDRPEKKNALDLDGWRSLADALDRAGEEARVAVLAGSGDAFCSGDDIASLADLGSEADVRELADCLARGLYGVERSPIPVVAAVDGLAYGGGFELVAAAHLAVATEGSTFALPETRIGAFPPYAVGRIGALCGKKRLLELALTGEPVDATTAHDWGLLNRVVPAGDLPGAVASLVDSVTEAPAAATRLATEYAALALADAGDRERLRGGFARVAGSEQCRAATRAFLDR
jgi:enoyl-CoA hydratase/carnithine racemase